MGYDATKGISVVYGVDLSHTGPTEIGRAVSVLDRVVIEDLLERNHPEGILEVVAGVFFKQLEKNTVLMAKVTELGIEIPAEERAGYTRNLDLAEQVATTIYATAHLVKAVQDETKGQTPQGVRVTVADTREAGGQTSAGSGAGVFDAGATTQGESEVRGQYEKLRTVLNLLAKG